MLRGGGGGGFFSAFHRATPVRNDGGRAHRPRPGQTETILRRFDDDNKRSGTHLVCSDNGDRSGEYANENEAQEETASTATGKKNTLTTTAVATAASATAAAAPAVV